MAQKTQRPRKALVLLAVIALLVTSLLFVACGSGANANNIGGSNISTSSTTAQQTATSTPGNLQSINQQVQTAVSSIDNAQDDVNGADSASNNDNGQQP